MAALYETIILCFQVNDFVRGKTRQKDGSVPLASEILAGGCVSLFLDISDGLLLDAGDFFYPDDSKHTVI